MNVLLQEIIQYRKGLLAWIIGLSLGALMFMPFLPAFADNVDSMKDFLAGMGQTLTGAIGIDFEVFFGPLGFFNYIYSFILLAAGIQALALGLRIIAKETRFKTADFLLTKPKSRISIYLQKVFAGIICLIITQVVVGLVCLFSLMAFSSQSFPMQTFLLLVSTLSTMQFFLFTLGILIAALIPKLKQTIGVAIGITLLFYVLYMVANVTEDELYNWFTPFKYFEGNYIITNQSYDTQMLVLGLSLTLLFFVVGLVVYRRRDVHSV